MRQGLKPAILFSFTARLKSWRLQKLLLVVQAIHIAVNKIAQRRRRVKKLAESTPTRKKRALGTPAGRQPWVNGKRFSAPEGRHKFDGLRAAGDACAAPPALVIIIEPFPSADALG